MVTLEKVLSVVKGLKEEVEKKYKARIIGIFGSYARGEQKEASDVDILVNFQENATLFDFVGLSLFLEEKLGLPVDIVPRDAIRDELRDRIEREVVYI